MFSVKISFVVRGRQAFFLHFLASSAGEEHSFLILLSSPVGDECSFLFSANPILQRRSFSHFFSIGLISNAHRAERSTNFLIMERRKYGAMLPAKTVCRLFMPYIREHRKTTAADLPSDCTQVALDSSRLKSTGDQGKNWTSQHQNRSFTNIIRDIALDGCLFSCQNSIIKSKNKEKNLAISENVHTFAPHLRTMLGKTETSHLKEGWVSGWNQQFAKLPCEFSYRGFESPSFRRQRSFKCKLIGRFI